MRRNSCTARRSGSASFPRARGGRLSCAGATARRVTSMYRWVCARGHARRIASFHSVSRSSVSTDTHGKFNRITRPHGPTTTRATVQKSHPNRPQAQLHLSARRGRGHGGKTRLMRPVRMFVNERSGSRADGRSSRERSFNRMAGFAKGDRQLPATLRHRPREFDARKLPIITRSARGQTCDPSANIVCATLPACPAAPRTPSATRGQVWSTHPIVCVSRRSINRDSIPQSSIKRQCEQCLH